jgi:outer membrane protein TolC
VVRAGAAQAESGRSQLQLGVAQVYWGVRLQRGAEEVSRASLALTRDHVEAARALVEVGSAAPQALLQAQLAEARAERDLMAATARREKSEDLFQALTGLKAEGDFEPPALPVLPWSSADEVLASSRESRPELKAAREQAQIARSYRSISQLGWAPTIDGRFTQAWTQNSGFSGENSTWMVVVSANWTLWDAGYRLTDNQRTASQAVQADANLQKLEEDTAVGVRAAWAEKERAARSLATAEKEASLAAENLRLTEASYRLGAGTPLELEEARVRRDGALLSVEAERMGLHLATLQLLALGGRLG